MAYVIDWGEVRSAVAPRECDREKLDEIYDLTRGPEREKLVHYLNDQGIKRWQWTMGDPRSSESVWFTTKYHHGSINDDVDEIFGSRVKEQLRHAPQGSEWMIPIDARLEDGTRPMHGSIVIRGRHGAPPRVSIAGWIPDHSKRYYYVGGFNDMETVGGLPSRDEIMRFEERIELNGLSTLTAGFAQMAQPMISGRDVIEALDAIRETFGPGRGQHSPHTMILDSETARALHQASRETRSMGTTQPSTPGPRRPPIRLEPPGRHASGGTKKKRKKPSKKSKRKKGKRSKKR